MPKSPLPFDAQQEKQSEKRNRHAARSFFTVLTLCLLAVGGVAASTFSNALKTTEDDPTFTTAATQETVSTTGVPAAAKTQTPTTIATTTTVSTTAATAAPTASAPLVVLPLKGTLLTPYSEQPLFNETMADYRAHTAMDFQGNENDTVVAVAAGTVTAFREDPLWGAVLTLDHGGNIQSVYRGVQSHLVIGSYLEAGQALGKLISVPCEAHLGFHLHFELYHEGKAVDPSSMIGSLLPSETE